MSVENRKSMLLRTIKSIPVSTFNGFGPGISILEIFNNSDFTKDETEILLTVLEREGKIETFRKSGPDSLISAVRAI